MTAPDTISTMLALWRAEVGKVVGRDPLTSPPYKKYPLPSKGTK